LVIEIMTTFWARHAGTKHGNVWGILVDLLRINCSIFKRRYTVPVALRTLQFDFPAMMDLNSFFVFADE